MNKIQKADADNTKKLWTDATKIVEDKDSQIAALKKITQAVTQEDVIKIDLLGDKLNQETGNIAFGVPDAYNWALLDHVSEGLKLVFETLDRLGSDDDKTRYAMRKLKTRMFAAIPATKSAVKQLKAASSKNDAIDSLTKQLSQVQKDMEEKDQTLLDQEKQLLQLTEENELQRNRLADLDDLSKGAGDKLKQLQQQLDSKNKALESVILANNEAQSEINNLNDALNGLNAELSETKDKFEPIKAQNEAYQQRYEHNERVVASVK